MLAETLGSAAQRRPVQRKRRPPTQACLAARVGLYVRGAFQQPTAVGRRGAERAARPRQPGRPRTAGPHRSATGARARLCGGRGGRRPEPTQSKTAACRVLRRGPRCGSARAFERGRPAACAARPAHTSMQDGGPELSGGRPQNSVGGCPAKAVGSLAGRLPASRVCVRVRDARHPPRVISAHACRGSCAAARAMHGCVHGAARRMPCVCARRRMRVSGGRDQIAAWVAGARGARVLRCMLRVRESVCIVLVWSNVTLTMGAAPPWDIMSRRARARQQRWAQQRRARQRRPCGRAARPGATKWPCAARRMRGRPGGFQCSAWPAGAWGPSRRLLGACGCERLCARAQAGAGRAGAQRCGARRGASCWRSVSQFCHAMVPLARGCGLRRRGWPSARHGMA